MDFTGPVHVGGHKRYLLNAIDYVTNWAYSQSSVTVTSQDVLRMINMISTAHGTPKELISDNGSQLISGEVQTILNVLKIKQKKKTTPYHPSTNGKCERFNGILKQVLVGLASDYPSLPFDDVLNLALGTYRQRPQSHGHSLYFLTCGCRPPFFASATAPSYDTEPAPHEETKQAIFTVYQQEREEDGVISVRKKK